MPGLTIPAEKDYHIICRLFELTQDVEMSFFHLWTILVTLANIGLAIFLPLDILFDCMSAGAYGSIYLIITLLFAIDLVVALNRLKKVKNSHLNPRYSTLILVDLIAAVPFGFFPGFRYLYLLQLIKLIRITSLMKRLLIKHLKYSGQLKLFFFFVWIAVSSHWISCGWLHLRGMDHEITGISNYVKSLYWTVTTLTSVGYGDITPDSNLQMIYAMVVQVLGFSVFGYIIGVIAGIFAKKDPSTQTYLDNLEKLRTMVQYRHISNELQERITDYYQYIYEKRLGYDESQFLNTLPNALRHAVALQLKKEVIALIPLFKNIKTDIISEIAINLKPLILTPGDYLFKADDPGNDMYFIIKGEIEILSKTEDKLLTRLSEGDFFGEIALFKNTPRTATAKASEYSDIYSLNRIAFTRVIERHPDVKRQLEEKAGVREKRYTARGPEQGK